jgi:hypothetical protein
LNREATWRIDVPFGWLFLIPRKVAGVLSVRCEVKNYKLMRKKIDDMKNAPRKVMTNLTAEAKKRVPGWVATEVAKEYVEFSKPFMGLTSWEIDR